MSTASEAQLRNFLESITTRLQRGEAVDPLLEPANEEQSNMEDIVELIQSLHASLTPMNPSQEYAENLRANLLDGRPGVAGRVRQMPARLSVAAILALFAGCLLLMLRRLFGSETATDVPEEAVATPL
ncbi:MAG: hypothetical protein OXG49_00465 [Chloroflexi bacterium]|nr:hypothetical protein [Chloroflexota bacterium]